ncbi:MAG: methionyl-tRNA formyltransferase [Halofilum sp. (in: g-proteobacteria)]
MSAAPLRVFFAGTPDFAVPALEALRAAGHDVRAVFTQPDRPAGRGRRLRAPPVKQSAQAADIPVFQPERLSVDALAAASGDPRPDVLVVVAFGQVLGREVLDYPHHGALNVHASLLPRWRGAAPIARALLAGDECTGVSIMQMDTGLDTGPVLSRRACPIDPAETAGTLHDRLAALGAEALIDVLADLPAHRATAEPQDDSAATYAAKLARADGRLAWGRPAAELARQVRALQPWPGAWTVYAGEPLRIWGAEAQGDEAAAVPGVVLTTGSTGIGVATGDGVLRLQRVQPAGGKPMGAADFANARALIGVRLGEG